MQVQAQWNGLINQFHSSYYFFSPLSFLEMKSTYLSVKENQSIKMLFQ